MMNNGIIRIIFTFFLAGVIMQPLSVASENNQPLFPDLDVSISNLKETVKFLTEIRPHRNYMHPGSLNRTADYIHDKFVEYGLEAKRQPFEIKGETFQNIIGSIGKEKNKRIIVGAHYDVCGDQPGADDNASAVAGLLEIARLVRSYFKNTENAEYGIEFAAYSLEEPPFFKTDQMGSYIHAKSLHDNKINVRAMICLEMIGYFTDLEKSQEYPAGFMKLFYPSVGNFIAVVGNFKSSALVNEVAGHLKKTDIPVKKLKAPALLPGVDFSDHRNYWHFGYPAVMITDTAFYRNPHYHQSGDTIDTLNFEKMSAVVKGVLLSILNIRP